MCVFIAYSGKNKFVSFFSSRSYAFSTIYVCIYICMFSGWKHTPYGKRQTLWTDPPWWSQSILDEIINSRQSFLHSYDTDQLDAIFNGKTNAITITPPAIGQLKKRSNSRTTDCFDNGTSTTQCQALIFLPIQASNVVPRFGKHNDSNNIIPTV